MAELVDTRNEFFEERADATDAALNEIKDRFNNIKMQVIGLYCALFDMDQEELILPSLQIAMTFLARSPYYDFMAVTMQLDIGALDPIETAYDRYTQFLKDEYERLNGTPYKPSVCNP